MWRLFLRPKWLAWHALVAALVAAFLALGAWQMRRASEGNLVSYGYALEWPLFAAFAIAVWYHTIRDRLRPNAGDDPEPPAATPAAPPPASRPVLPPRPAPAPPPEDDPALAAYNAYLANLADLDERDRNPDPATRPIPDLERMSHHA